MLIQKWIEKTTADQNFKNKKEAFNKSPIEIGPKLRCMSLLSMHLADMFLAKL